MAVNKLVVVMAAVMVFVAVTVAGAETQTHHVVGEDRGWDPSSDVSSWAIGRIFRVGDNLWFTYSVAQESLVELRNEEDFTSCNVTNPIRMYTDGLNKVSLEGEGTRYFTSGNPENCKNGLKLPVKVQPKEYSPAQTVIGSLAVAAGPTIPSASTNLDGLSYLVIVGLSLCLLGL